MTNMIWIHLVLHLAADGKLNWPNLSVVIYHILTAEDHTRNVNVIVCDRHRLKDLQH